MSSSHLQQERPTPPNHRFSTLDTKIADLKAAVRIRDTIKLSSAGNHYVVEFDGPLSKDGQSASFYLKQMHFNSEEKYKVAMDYYASLLSYGNSMPHNTNTVKLRGLHNSNDLEDHICEIVIISDYGHKLNEALQKIPPETLLGFLRETCRELKFIKGHFGISHGNICWANVYKMNKELKLGGFKPILSSGVQTELWRSAFLDLYGLERFDVFMIGLLLLEYLLSELPVVKDQNLSLEELRKGVLEVINGIASAPLRELLSKAIDFKNYSEFSLDELINQFSTIRSEELLRCIDKLQGVQAETLSSNKIYSQTVYSSAPSYTRVVRADSHSINLTQPSNANDYLSNDGTIKPQNIVIAPVMNESRTPNPIVVAQNYGSRNVTPSRTSIDPNVVKIVKPNFVVSESRPQNMTITSRQTLVQGSTSPLPNPARAYSPNVIPVVQSLGQYNHPLQPSFNQNPKIAQPSPHYSPFPNTRVGDREVIINSHNLGNSSIDQSTDSSIIGNKYVSNKPHTNVRSVNVPIPVTTSAQGNNIERPPLNPNRPTLYQSNVTTLKPKPANPINNYQQPQTKPSIYSSGQPLTNPNVVLSNQILPSNLRAPQSPHSNIYYQAPNPPTPNNPMKPKLPMSAPLVIQDKQPEYYINEKGQIFFTNPDQFKKGYPEKPESAFDAQTFPNQQSREVLGQNELEPKVDNPTYIENQPFGRSKSPIHFKIPSSSNTRSEFSKPFNPPNKVVINVSEYPTSNFNSEPKNPLPQNHLPKLYGFSKPIIAQQQNNPSRLNGMPTIAETIPQPYVVQRETINNRNVSNPSIPELHTQRKNDLPNTTTRIVHQGRTTYPETQAEFTQANSIPPIGPMYTQIDQRYIPYVQVKRSVSPIVQTKVEPSTTVVQNPVENTERAPISFNYTYAFVPFRLPSEESSNISFDTKQINFGIKKPSTIESKPGVHESLANESLENISFQHKATDRIASNTPNEETVNLNAQMVFVTPVVNLEVGNSELISTDAKQVSNPKEPSTKNIIMPVSDSKDPVSFINIEAGNNSRTSLRSNRANQDETIYKPESHREKVYAHSNQQLDALPEDPKNSLSQIEPIDNRIEDHTTSPQQQNEETKNQRSDNLSSSNFSGKNPSDSNIDFQKKRRTVTFMEDNHEQESKGLNLNALNGSNISLESKGKGLGSEANKETENNNNKSPKESLSKAELHGQASMKSASNRPSRNEISHDPANIQNALRRSDLSNGRQSDGNNKSLAKVDVMRLELEKLSESNTNAIIQKSSRIYILYLMRKDQSPSQQLSEVNGQSNPSISLAGEVSESNDNQSRHVHFEQGDINSRLTSKSHLNQSEPPSIMFGNPIPKAMHNSVKEITPNPSFGGSDRNHRLGSGLIDIGNNERESKQPSMKSFKQDNADSQPMNEEPLAVDDFSHKASEYNIDQDSLAVIDGTPKSEPTITVPVDVPQIMLNNVEYDDPGNENSQPNLLENYTKTPIVSLHENLDLNALMPKLGEPPMVPLKDHIGMPVPTEDQASLPDSQRNSVQEANPQYFVEPHTDSLKDVPQVLDVAPEQSLEDKAFVPEQNQQPELNSDPHTLDVPVINVNLLNDLQNDPSHRSIEVQSHPQSSQPISNEASMNEIISERSEYDAEDANEDEDMSDEPELDNPEDVDQSSGDEEFNFDDLSEDDADEPNDEEAIQGKMENDQVQEALGFFNEEDDEDNEDDFIDDEAELDKELEDEGDLYPSDDFSSDDPEISKDLKKARKALRKYGLKGAIRYLEKRKGRHGELGKIELSRALGAYYFRQRRYDLARKNLEWSLETYKKNFKLDIRPRSYSRIVGQLAVTEYKLKRYPQSLGYLKDSTFKIPKYQPKCYNLVRANYHYAMKEYDKARTHYANHLNNNYQRNGYYKTNWRGFSFVVNRTLKSYSYTKDRNGVKAYYKSISNLMKRPSTIPNEFKVGQHKGYSLVGPRTLKRFMKYAKDTKDPELMIDLFDMSRNTENLSSLNQLSKPEKSSFTQFVSEVKKHPKPTSVSADEWSKTIADVETQLEITNAEEENENPQEVFRKLCSKITNIFEMGQAERAIMLFDKLFKAYSDIDSTNNGAEYKMLLQLGKHLSKLNNPLDTQNFYEKLCKLECSQPDLHLKAQRKLGKIYFKQSLYGESYRWLKSYLLDHLFSNDENHNDWKNINMVSLYFISSIKNKSTDYVWVWEKFISRLDSNPRLYILRYIEMLYSFRNGRIGIKMADQEEKLKKEALKIVSNSKLNKQVKLVKLIDVCAKVLGLATNEKYSNTGVLLESLMEEELSLEHNVTNVSLFVFNLLEVWAHCQSDKIKESSKNDFKSSLLLTVSYLKRFPRCHQTIKETIQALKGTPKVIWMARFEKFKSNSASKSDGFDVNKPPGRNRQSLFVPSQADANKLKANTKATQRRSVL